MNLVIIFNDEASETLSVAVMGGLVASGTYWLPGHQVDEPCRCRFGSDYFAAAIDEGGLRSGGEQPEEADLDPDTGQPSWQGFRWELTGTEADDCRVKLRAWIDRLGADFDPDKQGADYLYEGLLRVFDDREACLYDADMQCCFTFLEDVYEETQQISADVGLPVNRAVTRPSKYHPNKAEQGRIHLKENTAKYPKTSL